jgi:hypothetical protein
MTDIPLSTASPDITLHGSFREEQERTYVHVPFEVPDGTEQLLIDLSYNDPVGSSPLARNGNTLDIGLFDQRGVEARGDGFRGWSGSVRTRIVIGTDRSTPPYRAGRPGAGIWHLLLGCYKIGPNGFEWTARVWFNPEITLPDTAPALPPDVDSLWRPTLPPPAESHWYRGDLHVHSIFSDGTGTPTDIAIAAVEAGLDFFAITDHNRAQAVDGLVPHGEGWPILVQGVEVTTYAGHFNVWGTSHWYDFREPTVAGLQQAVDQARADGGTVSLNHPKPFGPEWEYPEVTGFHAVEAWNGWWARFNSASLAWWHDRLARDPSMPMLGGSDMHEHRIFGAPERPLEPTRIGWPTTWVRVEEELSERSILAAVREGRTFVSESPSGPQLFDNVSHEELKFRVTHGAGHALLLVGPRGVVAAEGITGDDVEISMAVSDLRRNDERFVRPEIHAPGGTVKALGQPIHLE